MRDKCLTLAKKRYSIEKERERVSEMFSLVMVTFSMCDGFHMGCSHQQRTAEKKLGIYISGVKNISSAEIM